MPKKCSKHQTTKITHKPLIINTLHIVCSKYINGQTTRKTLIINELQAKNTFCSKLKIKRLVEI